MQILQGTKSGTRRGNIYTHIYWDLVTSALGGRVGELVLAGPPVRVVANIQVVVLAPARPHRQHQHQHSSVVLEKVPSEGS